MRIVCSETGIPSGFTDERSRMDNLLLSNNSDKRNVNVVYCALLTASLRKIVSGMPIPIQARYSPSVTY